MPNKYFAVLILIIISLLGGYFLLTKNSTSPSKVPVQTKEESMKIPQTGVSIVLSEQSNSGQAGIATIIEKNGKVVVSLKLTGVLVDTSKPAHLHLGTCEKPGKVKNPLNDVVDGQSETTLDIDMSTLNKQLPLILSVHKSNQEINVYTACGEIFL